MRINDIIPQLGQFHTLNTQQEENLGRLIEISKTFSEEAGIPFFHSAPVNNRTIVLESGHQPNFLPYPGVWKKAFLLDYIRRHLHELGMDAIAVFGFADYNLSTASYLFRNQVPAFNKQGSENIGFKTAEKNRWRCFHTLEKPSEERFLAEMEKIKRFYEENAKNLNSNREMIGYRTEQLTDLLQRSYERARSFSGMNATIFAGICTEILDLDILFFRYTDLQKNCLFIECSQQILNDIERYNSVYHLSASSHQTGVPPPEKGDVPFWYHCECGGKVHLMIDASSNFIGKCPVCEKEHRISMGPEYTNLAERYPRMSPNAVARNIIFAEGLGTTLFISGVGGGLHYGLIADAISRDMNIHRPLTLAWQSKDHYLGVVHQVALKELLRTFRLTPADLLDPGISRRIGEIRSALLQQVKEMQENGGDKKEIQRLEGRFLNSAVQAATVKKIFSSNPSVLDLLVTCDAKQISKQWNTGASEAEIIHEDHLIRMHGDVLYPCTPESPVAPDMIPEVYKTMVSIEVK